MNFDLFGKPILPDLKNLRIPYMGSKNSIAPQLLQRMLELRPKVKYFVDLFGGGGSMSFTALQLGLEVHYNEKQKGLVDLLNYVVNRSKNKEFGQYGLFPDDFYNFISREEFFKLKTEDSVKGQFARICYSFGNNQRNYLFCKEIEELKHLGHNIVMFRCKESLAKLNEITKSNFVLGNGRTWNERRLNFMSQINGRPNYKELEQLERLEQLQQLEQLQRLQQLEQLQRLPVFTITNLDFQDVKINSATEETIVYLDPPYRGTAKYLEDVLHKEIDQYFINSSYTCFMSEYSAPFESIFKIQKASVLNNSNIKEGERVYKTEKLFINKII